MKFVLLEEDQLSMDIDGAVASQVKRDIEEKEHQLESAMYYHYKDSLAGYNGADVKVSPDDTATIVTHWNVDDMSEELEYDVVKLFDQFEFRETQPHRVNDLKKTITFYISLGYGGSLDKEELKKEFLTLLAKNGTSEYTDRGFILPDGSLVGNEKFNMGGEPHYRVDDMITRKMAITNGVDEDEIIDAFGLKNNSRGLVADLCGCIRVNGWNEDYIALPPNKPTKQQLDTLEEWIDNFFETRGFNDYLYVTDFYGNNQKEYHSPEYEGKDIVDRIVRFYNTGNLYEEKQECKRIIIGRRRKK